MVWQIGLQQRGPTDKDPNDLMRKTSNEAVRVVHNDVDPQKSYNAILPTILASDLMNKPTTVWRAWPIVTWEQLKLKTSRKTGTVVHNNVAATRSHEEDQSWSWQSGPQRCGSTNILIMQLSRRFLQAISWLSPQWCGELDLLLHGRTQAKDQSKNWHCGSQQRGYNSKREEIQSWKLGQWLTTVCLLLERKPTTMWGYVAL